MCQTKFCDIRYLQQLEEVKKLRESFYESVGRPFESGRAYQENQKGIGKSDALFLLGGKNSGQNLSDECVADALTDRRLPEK